MKNNITKTITYKWISDEHIIKLWCNYKAKVIHTSKSHKIIISSWMEKWTFFLIKEDLYLLKNQDLLYIKEILFGWVNIIEEIKWL